MEKKILFSSTFYSITELPFMEAKVEKRTKSSLIINYISEKKENNDLASKKKNDNTKKKN
ncbi:MAG: hypothetical protein NT012_00150 [Candidatus Nealsonbacteria bacterium]|nr:hypothetical protein [Candidatus Nealsonbacteria bacterium]